MTAIVPVHLYGQMADMDPILELAEQLQADRDRRRLPGARRGVFFQAGEPLEEGRFDGQRCRLQLLSRQEPGACGEGGAVTTNDAALAQQDPDAARSRPGAEVLSRYRRLQRPAGCDSGRHPARQTPASCRLERKAPNRRPRYNELFVAAEGHAVLPYEPDWSKAIYHLYVIRMQNRGDCMNQLSDLGIGTGIHYPVPLTLQAAYKHLGYQEGAFSVTEMVSKEIVSLPMYPHLAADQQLRVVTEVMGLTTTV